MGKMRATALAGFITAGGGGVSLTGFYGQIQLLIEGDSREDTVFWLFKPADS